MLDDPALSTPPTAAAGAHLAGSEESPAAVRARCKDLELQIAREREAELVAELARIQERKRKAAAETEPPGDDLGQAMLAVTDLLTLSDKEDDDDGDVDSERAGDMPESVAALFPNGVLNVVLPDRSAARLTRRAPQYVGLSRKLALRLPPAFSRRLCGGGRSDRLDASRRHVEKRAGPLLASLQHCTRAVALIETAETQETLARAVAHIQAAMIIQADDIRRLVDSYRSKVLHAADYTPLALPEVLADLAITQVGTETFVFDDQEWVDVGCRRSKGDSSLDSLSGRLSRKNPRRFGRSSGRSTSGRSGRFAASPIVENRLAPLHFPPFPNDP